MKKGGVDGGGETVHEGGYFRPFLLVRNVVRYYEGAKNKKLTIERVLLFAPPSLLQPPPYTFKIPNLPFSKKR